MQLSDIDLLDRDRFTKGIPHEWFTFLRNEAPVYKHPEPDGPGFWVVTKYDDVVTVGRDGATYSSDQKRGGVVVLEETHPERLRAGAATSCSRWTRPSTRATASWSTAASRPGQIGALEDHIREQTDRILDEVIEQGDLRLRGRRRRRAPARR